MATPLSGDQKSLKRLLRKVERYLEFLKTKEFRSESGVPNPENTNIIVKLHPKSDRSAFDLLERSEDWVKSNGASLTVDTHF